MKYLKLKIELVIHCNMCTASKQIPCKVDGLNCKSPGRETLSTRETITGDLSGKLLTEAGIQQVITFFKRIQYLYSYFSFLVYRIIHTVFANYPSLLTTIVQLDLIPFAASVLG